MKGHAKMDFRSGERRIEGESTSMEALRRYLENAGTAVISYSGGVDSSLLAAVAKETIPGEARCVILDSPLVPRRTIREAKSRADLLGVPCEVVPFPILEDREFYKNPRNRCYICKRHGCAILLEKAGEYGIGHVMDGVNASDLEEKRPGIRAADEAGVLHPLADCGITKTEVRALARARGFLFWDQPSTPCLATRFPYGYELNFEDLRRIEEAEEFLEECGFLGIRVRMHGNLARIEVAKGDIVRLAMSAFEVSRKMRDLGFRFCTLDLEGQRSGSMEDV
ncbi:MAG: hypothetical protein A4E37_02199 [Methanoregulaceae archaeon PtaB.Bin056]|nr:MAG: hypothetical protein A4E37_02199 [Methanoregulaceae archaeon PtaB.Bin056]